MVSEKYFFNFYPAVVRDQIYHLKLYNTNEIKTMLMENCKIQRKNYKIRIEFHALQNKVIYNTI